MNEHKINSMEYWDDRFETNWESFLGREQTVFFLKLLLENLPEWLLNGIEEQQYSLCDAGCAEGDGTQLLANSFPHSKILGVDFSIEAINKAKEYYPNVEYVQGDIMNLPNHFDIVVCSNVLEHFTNPFEIIPLLIDKTIKHLIIMVPFLEKERIKEHLYTFEYSSFPLEINDYVLTYFKEIDCKLIEGTHWTGKQAIIIYSNQATNRKNNLSLAAFNNIDNFYEDEYFKNIEQIKLLEANIKEKEDNLNWSYKKIEEKDSIINNLVNSLGEKDTVINSLVGSLEKKENIINHFLEDIEEGKLKTTQLEQQIYHNNHELYNLNHQILSMQQTKGWRILNRYYRFIHSVRNVKSNMKKFIYISKTKGLKEAVNRSFVYINARETNHVVNNSVKLIDLYSKILNEYRNGAIKGIAIIPSAFEFDELYNQRTINLAKYLSKKGYAVVYVAWQWDKKDSINNSYECFLERIYQVPLFDFIETQFNLINEIQDKKFFITFPTEAFYKLIVPFRENAFHIIYDIMDEWEEFYNTGEAPWYKKEIEEAIIVNSDLVVGVSEPLKGKFNFLRNDILVIGNGYDENISKMRDIALKKEAIDNMIHMGYFGHLTSSWFDWDLVFDLAKKENFFIHLIGYGVDDTILKKLKEYKNIKFYGKVHPGELHHYVKEWHLGLIPFKKSKLSIAVDPIKIYEYLFFGLPTISTGIPHIGNYPIVTHCDDTQNVIESVEEVYTKIMNNSLEVIELEEFLVNSTWESRFRKMMHEIDNTDFFQSLFKGELK
ncbi:methyltransferase domain-containing protein [Lysinibacillus sp. fls2-241-R2A-57]|uniref:methyltransferase domain-containing protein n=1 Tax=Lysinibacillus sp. fls2-241-R2A-57 TaxID=3040292 RepID=UPI0025550AD2|nr:methyltransferase domain-containing protein [Lysinibacillus sp. fls2-241-R2A-57]